MSMEAIRNNRGAVSIFLILVLVPCIAISCIFVDVSRVELSKSSAEASADLALNTLLTNYDADLSEYYGLIGSCQNIEDFYTVSAEYFLRTISSQGLSNDEIHLLAGVYANATSDDTIYDLLQVECVSADKTALVSEGPNANLGNPAMLKDSVVEFMKYRAPIEIASSLIERLTSGDIGLDGFLESKENDKLVQEKQQFYESEGKLMEAAIYTYLAIRDYEIKASETPKFDNAKLRQDQAKLDNYRNAYQQIHKIAVEYYLNTSQLSGKCERPKYDIASFETVGTQDYARVCSSTETIDGTTYYYLNGNKLNTQVEAARRTISELEILTASYINLSSDLMTKYYPSDKGYSPVRWWVAMDKAVNRGEEGNLTSDIWEKGKAVMNAYKNIKAMKEGCTKEPKPEKAGNDYIELPDDWVTTCDTVLSELKKCYEKNLSASAPETDAYIKAANALERVSGDYYRKLAYDSHSVTVDRKKLPTDEALVYISDQLRAMRKEYDSIISKLNTAINGDGGDTKSLDTLLNLAKTYGTEFGQYESAANSSSTSLGEKERGEIEKLTLQSEITGESVTELKNRLVNIKGQFETLRSKIDGLVYGGYAVKDIRSFTNFTAGAYTVIEPSQIPMTQSALEAFADEKFELLYKPEKGKEVKLSNLDNDDFNPDLDVKTPALYAYMKEEFKDVQEEKLKQESEDESSTKNLQKEYENGIKNKTTEYRGNADATMTNVYGWTDESTFGVTNILGSLVDLVKALVDGNFASIRDNMYATTYVMEMLSYASFDREAMYRNMGEQDRKNMIPSDANKEHTYFKEKKVYGDPAGNLDEQEGMWVSTKEKDTFNKSLTNKMIDLNNNHVYLAEVEYLLYGNSSPAENLKKSYGDIYALRFILNTTSAFSNFWTGTKGTALAVNTAASLISGMFGGVVPPPVIKAVLLPMLAAIETCKDNQRLFAGMPVELYKMTADDWWVGVDNATNYKEFFTALIGDDTRGENKDKGLFYSDYMMLFVYCSFTKASNEAGMYQRLAELIEANVGKIIKEDDYSLKNTRMYFSLKADLRVKPLMVTIPYYLDEYDTKGMRTAPDWCSYDIDIVRGYS